jgi:hypothetical protein
MTFLSPFRPIILVLSLLLLGYFSWRLYLNKANCGKCVENPRARTIAREVFWIGLGLVVFSFSFQRLVLVISSLIESL